MLGCFFGARRLAWRGFRGCCRCLSSKLPDAVRGSAHVCVWCPEHRHPPGGPHAPYRQKNVLRSIPNKLRNFAWHCHLKPPCPDLSWFYLQLSNFGKTKLKRRPHRHLARPETPRCGIQHRRDWPVLGDSARQFRNDGRHQVRTPRRSEKVRCPSPPPPAVLYKFNGAICPARGVTYPGTSHVVLGAP